MALELIEPGVFVTNRLAEDEASLSKSGELAVRSETWQLVSGGEQATVVVDRERLILGVRPARPDEKAYRVNRSRNSRRDTGRAVINVKRAIQRLALTCEATAGRWPLTTKENTLFIHFGGKRNEGEKSR